MKKTSTKKGLELEIVWSANTVEARRLGHEVEPEEDYGKRINMCWDVVLIQSALKTNLVKILQ